MWTKQKKKKTHPIVHTAHFFSFHLFFDSKCVCMCEKKWFENVETRVKWMKNVQCCQWFVRHSLLYKDTATVSHIPIHSMLLLPIDLRSSPLNSQRRGHICCRWAFPSPIYTRFARFEIQLYIAINAENIINSPVCFFFLFSPAYFHCSLQIRLWVYDQMYYTTSSDTAELVWCTQLTKFFAFARDRIHLLNIYFIILFEM